MINLSNHLFDYEPYPLGHLRKFLQKVFTITLCEEYPDISELKISEDKKKYNLQKFNKYSLTNDHNEFNNLLKRKRNFLNLYKFLDSREFSIKFQKF